MSAADCAGWTAAALMLATFLCEGVLVLRSFALAANVAFIVYGSLAGAPHVLALHGLLIVVNGVRLARVLRVPAERAIAAASWR